jgi:hypothetical protein
MIEQHVTDEAFERFEEEYADLRLRLKAEGNSLLAAQLGEVGRLYRFAEKALEQERKANARRTQALELKRQQSLRLALRGSAAKLGDGFNPNGYFVYVLWGDEADQPLYVGQSINVLARLGAHMNEPLKRAAVQSVALIRCKSQKHMTATEIELIRTLRPEWNVRHGLVGVPA